MVTVLVPEQITKDNELIPELICEINNYNLNYPIEMNKIKNFNYDLEKIEDYSILEDFSNKEVKVQNNNLKINEVIRTEHMNSEERKKK